MGAHGQGRRIEKCGAVMFRYSEEQIKAARQMTAMGYLQRHQPYRLKKSSARNEWELTDHDSFKINGITSQWHWKSRDIGGICALNFLIKVDGVDFKEAVSMLLQETPCYIPATPEKKEKKPFMLPEQYRNCRRVQDYLNRRGISDGVIRYCRMAGILYESAPYHNAVFVGLDEEDKARYAFLRGIYDNAKPFRIEQAGSDKKYAFCIPPAGESSRVAVYEACIDALAHMTLEGGAADKYRLALGGISAPKEGETRGQGKSPSALAYFLSKNPEIREIEICTDNDFAGRWACGQIRQAYQDRYRIIENLPRTEGADYGDLAAKAAEKKRKRNVSKTHEQGR